MERGEKVLLTASGMRASFLISRLKSTPVLRAWRNVANWRSLGWWRQVCESRSMMLSYRGPIYQAVLRSWRRHIIYKISHIWAYNNIRNSNCVECAIPAISMGFSLCLQDCFRHSLPIVFQTGGFTLEAVFSLKTGLLGRIIRVFAIF